MRLPWKVRESKLLTIGKMVFQSWQKDINYDTRLFSSLLQGYEFIQWELKGRFNEEDAGPIKDPQSVNEAARELYYREVQGLVGVLNKEIAQDEATLYVPDVKFRRGIGEYKGKRFSVTGEALDEEAYARHLQDALPSQQDREELRKITREAGWIAAAN